MHVVSEAGPEMVANFEGNPVRRCLSCIFLNGWNCGEKYFLDFFFSRAFCYGAHIVLDRVVLNRMLCPVVQGEMS